MISNWFSKILFLDYKIIHKKGFHLSFCPNCGEYATLERLAEKGKLKRLPRFFGFKEYHCRSCKWDGYLHTKRLTENPKRVFRNYVIALFWFLVFGIVLSFALKYYYDSL